MCRVWRVWRRHIVAGVASVAGIDDVAGVVGIEDVVGVAGVSRLRNPQYLGLAGVTGSMAGGSFYGYGSNL